MLVDRLAPSTMEENPLWLVVLCDMMTLLMLFFLVMYALTQQSPEARRQFLRTFDAKAVVSPEAPAPSVPEFREEDTAARLSTMLSEAGLERTVEVRDERDTVRVRLRSRMLFPTAGAELEPGSAKPLSLLAELLKQMPNEVVVEGHTDSVPITKAPYPSNWELSVARSYAVVERLQREGVAARRLVAAGYGEYRPIAANESAAGRARNRRVEIVILRCPKGAVGEGSDCLGRTSHSPAAPLGRTSHSPHEARHNGAAAPLGRPIGSER